MVVEKKHQKKPKKVKAVSSKDLNPDGSIKAPMSTQEKKALYQKEQIEKKQREKYGDSPEYEKWVARTWAGPMLGAPKVMPPRRVTDAFERVAWSGPAFPKK